MAQAPWLSILIPVYNVEAYLSACIESVTAQADANVEIIAIDDCSTDNSKEVLNNLALQSPIPIRVMQHDVNRGLSAARNSMLDVASGKYIWFLDSDDLMEPRAIQQLKKIVDAHQPDLIMCDFRVLRAKQKRKHRLRGENHRHSFVGDANILSHDPTKLFYGLYKKGELHIWSKITKRAMWDDDLRFPVDRYMEDMVLTPRLLLRAKSYFYQSDVWVAYRQREGSILATANRKKIDDAALGSSGVLAEWLAQNPQLDDEARLAFSHYCAKTHYVVMRDLRRWDATQFKQQQKLYRQKLLDNIHWSPLQLCWQYLKHGSFFQIIRFMIRY